MSGLYDEDGVDGPFARAMRRRTLAERIADAEARAASALGNANEARERGRKAATVERYEATAQKWLDTANRLRGHGDGSDS